MLKKIRIILFICTIVSFNSLLAQELSESWELIKSDDISDIFIEPSNIIDYGNEISVWAIEKLNEPKITENGKKTFSMKTHYLFNKMKKKYAEIGVLYYNEKGGIINRSSTSSINAGPSVFMTPISYNPNTEIIYKEVISYLITGNVESTKYDSNNKQETTAVVQHQSSSRENNKSNENSSNTNLPVESWTEIPKINERLEITEKPSIKSGSSLNKKMLDNSINIYSDKPKEYNFNHERALKNAIFTDGNLYCFQVSSWKTKSYADRELNKLIAKGYNAFLVSVKPKNKNSIWHRVRVGYFDSLSKTKSVQRGIKKTIH